MGIQVPDLDTATGLVLPNAYVAVSKNSLFVQPEDTQYRVFTAYNIWASYEARQAQKQPLETRQLNTPASSLDNAYASIYAAIKDVFPGHSDVLEDLLPVHSDVVEDLLPVHSDVLEDLLPVHSDVVEDLPPVHSDVLE